MSGWVQRIRDKGGMIWIDLRDRYGITQLMFDESKSDKDVIDVARSVGREFVIKVNGTVIERFSKNNKLTTGDIEIFVDGIEVLTRSKVPPFVIEDDTDGGEDLRMKYRYLDLRRNPIRQNLELRQKLMQETRRYFEGENFIEVETPFLFYMWASHLAASQLHHCP